MTCTDTDWHPPRRRLRVATAVLAGVLTLSASQCWPVAARAALPVLARTSLPARTSLLARTSVPARTSLLARTSVPATTSYFESTTDPRVLYGQGEAAGKAAAQGLVILDFGRPAEDASLYGTMGFRGAFLSLNSVARGVESYISGYYRYAPAHTVLRVALGTNNSCGPGQPCGGGVCGCPDEPVDLAAWGRGLALTVEQVDSWAMSTKVRYGYTDDVRVVAADDAEPAYDPGFTNTYALLNGYARTVGGRRPAMVDDGSAEDPYWSKAQLYQVAYGFPPDVPMPEIYNAAQAAEWAALLRYAKAKQGKLVRIFGVLTDGPGNDGPAKAYAEMLSAAAKVNGQQSIPWVSAIATAP